ncbi:L-sorbosone dehydrogenase [Paramyrothecium foliicola]|nr:L-sorbosone dehydrogenase [Paramyrothecium foliicola]
MALRSAATTALVATSLLAQTGAAQDSCSNTLSVDYPAPVAAEGWSYRLVANNFTKPRGLVFDRDGGLLVIDSGVGLVHLTLQDDGATCLSVTEKKTLVEHDKLNHGLQLSEDGNTVYASTADKVFSWSYDSRDKSVGDTNRTLVTNMTNPELVTRTLLLSRKEPGVLLVSRGSDSDDDPDALNLESGRSQIRSFNLTALARDADPYQYLDGDVIGWGLRNSVGVAEEPVHGGIWSVENSIDEIVRNGKDIHRDNPAEELNFHGYLNGSTEHQGGNYGYPNCFAIWSTENFPDLGDLEVGDQFPEAETQSLNDGTCNSDFVAPRLAFQAHTAPLDIKFNQDGSEAFVAFHGSFSREDPVGYTVSSIAFNTANGQPEAEQSSNTAAVNVLSNPDLGNCPGNCFRPAGLTFDSEGRLWFTSDTTGEIFVLQRTGNSGNGGSDNSDGDSAAGQLVPSRSVAVGVAFAAAVAGFLFA